MNLRGDGTRAAPELRFRLMALCFALGSAAHLVAFLFPSIIGIYPPGYPGWRHIAFTCVDLGLAWGMLARPRYFALVLALFLGQQIMSHGSSVRQQWAAEGQLDWLSIAVLLFLVYAIVSVIRAPPRVRHTLK